MYRGRCRTSERWVEEHIALLYIEEIESSPSNHDQSIVQPQPIAQPCPERAGWQMIM